MRKHTIRSQARKNQASKKYDFAARRAELPNLCRVIGQEKQGGYHGLRKRRFTVADRDSASDHSITSDFYAPLMCISSEPDGRLLNNDPGKSSGSFFIASMLVEIKAGTNCRRKSRLREGS
jgi:hypothetical protein